MSSQLLAMEVFNYLWQKKRVSAGQNIDTANPHFLEGGITNPAQLAAHMLLGSQQLLLWLFLGAQSLSERDLCMHHVSLFSLKT